MRPLFVHAISKNENDEKREHRPSKCQMLPDSKEHFFLLGDEMGIDHVEHETKGRQEAPQIAPMAQLNMTEPVLPFTFSLYPAKKSPPKIRIQTAQIANCISPTSES
ncbi:hypothetical protein A3A71_03560 [Candidatus Berkelbacteria bacterium RIFCSPLOWO2_01_FULL_50_28]|uniref:Uncharacterized protein n=1 Tax=Candidatus Berkelbacteria bacterium RIFCSPLOWO2_01_FULL_50_28 TaxID=1797471 RepID=A0A1F5ECQ7_9BACT|nr:MAG: hypothetical protein A2807_03125 [Candidatus Berkelbacteria bacterium RIFCSPHIGHO2_01_FULL_50_36]OGD63654.1 MAG: hypothetical protein A3F39_04340 [Candidatus Berkelbacteria bacterium RIFCSPHIGHO2_12_FULL_50_11]OGD65131.1 MAG: hypothetical protein A3A71_03560 [Candidatus Berkelbacteria bacterium RIFCSPLOWO2_01_FULL_50_28]